MKTIDLSDCWLYAGHIESRGYGIYQHRLNGHKVNERVHRLVYEAFRGSIPKDLVLDHLCRVRQCVNPNHLEAVTNEENLLRGISTPNMNAFKTHCASGHEFNGKNTRIYRQRRICRSCDNTRHKKLKQTTKSSAQVSPAAVVGRNNN